MTRARVKRSSAVRWVPFTQIHISQHCQRTFRPAWAKQIAADFDPDAFRHPVLSHRDDRYWCLDGQHTIAAFREMGWEDQVVECVVYEGLDEAGEADLFLKLNNTKSVGSLETFRIAVNAGRPEEVSITRIARQLDLNIGPQKQQIGAVAALRNVYKAGPDELQRTLRIIRDSYGIPGMTGEVITGIGLVCSRYNGQVDEPVLVTKLAKVRGGVNGLLGRAQQEKKATGKALRQCIAATVVVILNEGRGGKKLPSWWHIERDES